MSQLKRVISKLVLVRETGKSQRISGLLKKYKSKDVEKSLKRGYEEMALINLSLAEMCLDADNGELRQYEEKLTECE